MIAPMNMNTLMIQPNRSRASPAKRVRLSARRIRPGRAIKVAIGVITGRVHLEHQGARDPTLQWQSASLSRYPGPLIRQPDHPPRA
jgi:hypothetical protein